MSKKGFTACWEAGANRPTFRGGKQALDVQDFGREETDDYYLELLQEEEEEEEWYEEEEEEETEAETEDQVSGDSNAVESSQASSHVDPATQAATLGAFFDATATTSSSRKKSNRKIVADSPPLTPTTTTTSLSPKPQHDVLPLSNGEKKLSKKERQKLVNELILHGARAESIPSQPTALVTMHASVLSGDLKLTTSAISPSNKSSEEERQHAANTLSFASWNPQHHHKSHEQGKAIEELPEEMWDQIFGFLPFTCVVAVASTCTWMKYAASCCTSLRVDGELRVVCQTKKIDRAQNNAAASSTKKRRDAYVWGSAFYYVPVTHVSVHFPPQQNHTNLDQRKNRDNNHTAMLPLEFPWNTYDSLRFHIAREQEQQWGDLLAKHDSTIEYYPFPIYRRMENGEVMTIKRELHPENNQHRKELLEKLIGESEQVARRIRAGVWMDVFNGLDLSTAALQIASNTTTELCGGHTVEDAQRSDEASVDPKHSALHAYCRIKANEAAGMFNVAHKLAEEAVEHKAWQMRDAGSLLAKNIGVPTSEAAWVALARQLSTASLDSDEANEDDVTLRENAQRSGPLFKPRDYHHPAQMYKSDRQLKQEAVLASRDHLKLSNTTPYKSAEQKLRERLTPSQWRLHKQMTNSGQ